ncbi:MAG: pectin acetylesterase-family hydrolase [Sandaracinaceae bacterium]
MRYLVTLSLLLSACGGEMPDADAGNPGTDGGGRDGATGLDAGMTGSDASVDAGMRSDAGPGGDPFVAPADTWTVVEVDGTECGNGSVMPVAVNLHPGSDHVFIFLQGGGACWDNLTCFVLGSASHIQDTLTEATVLGEAARLDPFLANRNPAVGPFPDANFVYVPYCTGDLHAGTHVTDYGGGRTVHHVGAHNMDRILERMFATVSGASRVWVGGASAGGYGSILNFWRVRDRWPGVRVDVLDDSGTPVQMAMDRYNAAIASWEPELPAGCTDCAAMGFPAILPYYASSITSPHRLAILSYSRDNVISTFFGITLDQFEMRAEAMRQGMTTTSYQRAFITIGEGHVVLADPTLTAPGGLTAAEWTRRFASDDPLWDDEGP